MTWESAVIIGLCLINLLTLCWLAVGRRPFRPDPLCVYGSPQNSKPSNGRIPLTDPDPYKTGGKPKDQSVILMTQERDDRLLAEEEN